MSGIANLIISTCVILLLLLVFCIASIIVDENKKNIPIKQCNQDFENISLLKNKEDYQTKIVFLAAARNAIKGLPFFLSNLTRIKKIYPSIRLVIMENDSIDGTREYIEQNFPSILETKIINPSFEIDKASPTTGRSVKRVQRMAKIRNELLKHIEKQDDYVVMIDPDWDICIPILLFERAIQYMESKKETIAACFPLFLHHHSIFPFIDVYFDTFAFQNSEFKNPGENQWEKLHLALKKWPKSKEIEVESAFGTFGIYRKDDIGQSKYAALLEQKINNTNKETKSRCEHVAFNQDIRNFSKKKMELLTWFEIVN